MTIKEFRAKVFMGMMRAKSGSDLERHYKEKLQAIDKVILWSKEDYDNLNKTKYGYVVLKNE